MSDIRRGGGSVSETGVQDRPDQAVALRRRRLRHPMAALDSIPSNSLASVYGLLDECDAATRARPRRRYRDRGLRRVQHRRRRQGRDRARSSAAGGGFVGLVGVQSNQFPRALDLARQFRAAGMPVVIGGFHVSGCISMLPELPPDLKEALDLGITCSRARPKAAWPSCCATSTRGTLKPIYNYLHDMPDMEAATLPILPRDDRAPRRRPLHQLRCRPRLPVPVQLLHHHQRAGPQVALSHARRRRGDRARQRRAGRHALLRHRRQFRPQQELGADPRPADRTARAATASGSGCCCRSTRCATASRASSRRRRARAATRCSSGWRTSIPNR